MQDYDGTISDLIGADRLPYLSLLVHEVNLFSSGRRYDFWDENESAGQCVLQSQDELIPSEPNLLHKLIDTTR